MTVAYTKEQQKAMNQLLELDGAVLHEECDVFSKGIDSPSPSLNYCFDNSWCLPDGYTLLLGGAPKGGKSLLISAMFGKMQQEDPDAVVMKFNTEYREKAQVTPAQLRLWGIDVNRYRAFDTNRPEHVFDRIEQFVPKLVQSGVKLRAIAIDSVNDILGRRAVNSDTVNQQQIGDKALTLQDGFQRIKGVLRENNVSLILTCQIRAEMDMAEQMRGNKVKMAVPWAVKHLAEYFMYVERLAIKAGRTDLSGNEFKDDSKVDLTGQGKSDGDEFGHKIRVKMLDNSLGRPGRIGVFTLHHDFGIINTHEEVFLLGVGFKMLARDGGSNYSFVKHEAIDPKLTGYLDRSWKGKEAMLEAIRTNEDLYKGILATCKRVDLDRKNGILYDAEGKRTTSWETSPKSEESPSEEAES